MGSDYDCDLQCAGFRAASWGSTTDLGCIQQQVNFTELWAPQGFYLHRRWGSKVDLKDRNELVTEKPWTHPFIPVSTSWTMKWGVVMTAFLSLCRKGFRSKTDTGKQDWFIEHESTHLGKCNQNSGIHPENVTVRGIYPSWGGNWWHSIDMNHSPPTLGRTIYFPLFLS